MDYPYQDKTRQFPGWTPLKTEAVAATLNPAYYARRFKPEALWSEEEKALAASDPTFEPEGRVWGSSVVNGIMYPAGERWR